MSVLISLIIFVIVVLIIAIVWARNDVFYYEEKEPFLRARAFYSCPPSINCKKDAPVVTDNDLLIINPYIWPYSGTFVPQEVINDKPPAAIIPSINGEQDHELATN